MKIAIMGFSGSGKSTLAKKLGEKYQIEVLYIDTVHWLPGWKARTHEEKNAIIGDFMDKHSSWVMDGNYSRSLFERRVEEADQIILVCFNRFSCLYRAFKRRFQYNGKSRESITVGCDEKIDLGFVWWILHSGRTKRHKDRFRKIMERYPEKTIMIRNQKQLDAFGRNMEL